MLQGFGVRVSPTERKVWFVVTRVGDRQKRVTIGTYPAISLAEARDEARKLIRNAQLGVTEDAPSVEAPTLGEAIPIFINLYAKPKNRSWRGCERLLGTFQALANKPLGEIKRSDLARVLDQMIASGTPYRANRALSALKKLMAWALDRGMIEVNPIAGLKAPAVEQSRDRILTDRELRDLLVAADQEGYPFGSLIKVLALTGQRRAFLATMPRTPNSYHCVLAFFNVPCPRFPSMPSMPWALLQYRKRVLSLSNLWLGAPWRPSIGLNSPSAPATRTAHALVWARVAGILKAADRLTRQGLRGGVGRSQKLSADS
jgi:hypothetical protein